MVALARLALLVSTFSLYLAAAVQIPNFGFYGHKKINRISVYTLHGELFEFFREHIDWLSANAINPDKRRYTLTGEAARHYIDIDHYGEWPFEDLPRDWDSALAKFTEDTLQAYGVAPWWIEINYWSLVAAFQEGEASKILKRAADLGHYVADIHVPLHCTKNYNGELTGQEGIHAFWESRIPELFGESFDLYTDKAVYVSDKSALIWEIILESAALVDSVLGIEAALSEATKPHKKYAFEERGGTAVRQYSKKYAARYYERLNHMVERRMRQAIFRLGCFWYSAWVDAGKPNLPTQTQRPPPDQSTKDSLSSIPGELIPVRPQ